MKNCLIIYYSQSGQAHDIARAVCEPLKDAFNLHFEELRPVTPYPFPWKGMSFFQAFPESVREIPCELEPFSFDPTIEFDLVILAYPVWYLSPPIPLTSFLRSEEGKKAINGAPVITLLGVRNMWAMAQERVITMINDAGGKLVGNIVMADPHPNLVSVITIVRWMMTAERHGKGLYGKVFPPAGVPGKDIQSASRFGMTILTAFSEGNLKNLQVTLVGQGAVKVNPVLVNIEIRAKKMFGLLSAWILKKGGSNSPHRVGRLKVFKYYLFTVIYLVSPLASAIFWIGSKLNPGPAGKLKSHYSAVDR